MLYVCVCVHMWFPMVLRKSRLTTMNVSITSSVLKTNSLPSRNQETEDCKILKDFFSLLVDCFKKKQR